jgi:hypothetical protein
VIRRLSVALAILVAATAYAAAPVKILQTWTGRMPVEVAPLLQSSASSQEQWDNVWATCQRKGAAPKVDFGKHLVLVAVRRSSVVRFQDVKLDDGNLMTNVVAAPDVPGHMTCAFALVARAGVTNVNGAPPGK